MTRAYDLKVDAGFKKNNKLKQNRACFLGSVIVHALVTKLLALKYLLCRLLWEDYFLSLASPGWGRRGTAAATIAARLTFEDLTRSFDGKEALRGVSLDIEPSETVCLLGPSGCGKTTLLRIAAGIERPDTGRVLFNHQEVVGPTVFTPPEKRGVGLMFQDFALFPHLTILQNVMFGLQNLDVKAAKPIALATLERVGLAHYADDYPHILSGGQQQRVALARAIAPRPSIIFMDEPFSGLDPRLRDRMREETLAILREMRATSMIVTHQAEEAMRMGDRIAVMRDGRILQVGKSEEIYSYPNSLFVARIFAEMNEIPCIVKKGEVETVFGRFPANELEEGSEAVFCARFLDMGVSVEGPGVLGRVIDRKFLGGSALLEIVVDGLDLPLQVRMRENIAPSVGEETYVFVETDQSLILAKDD